MYNIQKYEFINFFRALAAFWVVTAHSMIWGGYEYKYMPNAKIAVDLFMMISGFLMTSQAFMRNSNEPMNERISWYKFWLRRFFRIAPAYYLSLILAVLLNSYFLEGYYLLQEMNPDRWSGTIAYNPHRIQYDFENLLLHITFLFGLHPTYSFSTFLPDWSLSLEMQFYFVFPLLFLFIKRINIFKACLTVGLISISIGFIFNHLLNYYEPSFLFLKLQYFLGGILIYFILYKMKTYFQKLILLLMAIFFVSVEINLSYGNQMAIPMILLLSMLFIGWLEQQKILPMLIFTLINSRIIRFMSDSSFSVYLFHGFLISMSGILISKIPALNHASLFVHTSFIFFITILLVYPFAYIVFLTIEKNGIQYGRDLINFWFPSNSNLKLNKG